MDSAGAFGKGKRTVQAVRSRKGERERQEEKEGEERQGRQCETKSSQGRQTVRDDTDYLREQSDAIVLFEPIRLSQNGYGMENVTKKKLANSTRPTFPCFSVSVFLLRNETHVGSRLSTHFYPQSTPPWREGQRNCRSDDTCSFMFHPSLLLVPFPLQQSNIPRKVMSQKSIPGHSWAPTGVGWQKGFRQLNNKRAGDTQAWLDAKGACSTIHRRREAPPTCAIPII